MEVPWSTRDIHARDLPKRIVLENRSAARSGAEHRAPVCVLRVRGRLCLRRNASETLTALPCGTILAVVDTLTSI